MKYTFLVILCLLIIAGISSCGAPKVPELSAPVAPTTQKWPAQKPALECKFVDEGEPSEVTRLQIAYKRVKAYAHCAHDKLGIWDRTWDAEPPKGSQ